MDGKRVASFTNEEEDSLGFVDVMPFLLEDRLKERGALHTKAANYVCNTEQDGRLITGQNPASAAVVAELVVAELRGAMVGGLPDPVRALPPQPPTTVVDNCREGEEPCRV